jgi:hypothetical protein
MEERMAESAGGGIGFASTIQPYFTQLDRDQMMDANHTSGFTLDLWSASDVQQNFAMISRVIQRGQMPPAGSPPYSDGPWAQSKITQFLSDFNAWKAAGFPP